MQRSGSRPSVSSLREDWIWVLQENGLEDSGAVSSSMNDRVDKDHRILDTAEGKVFVELCSSIDSLEVPLYIIMAIWG